MRQILMKYRRLPIQVKASTWFMICSILQKGIAFITIPIFTRLLTTEQYGQYNIFNSWQSIIMIFATLNLTAGVFNNAMIKYEDDRDSYTSSMQGLTTFITIGCFIIYLVFRNTFNKLFGLSTSLMTVMFMVLLVQPSLGFWSTRQRFDFKYKKLVAITLGMSIANAIVGIVAVIIFNEKGIARILSAAIVEIFVCSILYAYNIIKGKKLYIKEYWKFSLKFNVPLIPHYLSQTVLNQSDRIMINNLVGTDKAGIYSLAYSVAMLMIIVNTSINQTFVPWMYKKLKDRKYEEISEIANFILLLIASMILFLIALAPEIITLLSSNEYYEAIWVIPPVAASVFFMFLYNLFANVEFYYEENKFVMIASVIGASLNIVLNYIFIPIYGYLAAGYTTLACYIVYSFAHYFFMRKVCRKHINGTKIYNLNFILILSVVLVTASLLIMSIYKFQVIRYSIILIILVIIVVKRKEIVKELKRMRNS